MESTHEKSGLASQHPAQNRSAMQAELKRLESEHEAAAKTVQELANRKLKLYRQIEALEEKDQDG